MPTDTSPGAVVCPAPARECGCYLDPRLMTIESPTVADARVQTAIDMITRRYVEPLQARDVARAVGFSVSHFGRRFKQETGLSFKAFLLRLRVTQARNLLFFDPIVRIKQVAAAAGYGDRPVLTFTRDFRKYWGCPPSQCQKSGRLARFVNK